MANRTLDAAQRSLADQLLLALREQLKALSGGDPELLFAFLPKELSYDERRRASSSTRSSVLDRFVESAGDTPENTRLICQSCDTKTQASRGYQ
ncbi:MAG: hypothetical protein DI536_32735 [Archangium gephyra]|uniref:Uncharacterized protein n=1 Tax=Archangium gephyra TaxID=48 RepID=A0A2W5SPU7_9BACT|nr:MAG: hypothetical protein DI536_32735 [Archangium gephyra]